MTMKMQKVRKLTQASTITAPSVRLMMKAPM
jgi:hypothetical protein